MIRAPRIVIATLFAFALVSFCNFDAAAQQQRPLRRAVSPAGSRRSVRRSRLTGVYRLDVGSSDKLYSVVTGASSNLSAAEQTRFFDDLTVRLAAPDQLAIEQRGTLISIASSRAPRLSFEADGVERAEQATDGRVVRTRAALNGDQLIVSTGDNRNEQFTVTFAPLEEGRRLQVTRRISAAQLTQPVVIHSIYNKSSDIAQWSIYTEPSAATPDTTTADATRPPARDTAAYASPDAKRTPAITATKTSATRVESAQAIALGAALDEWIAATNARDIPRQMTFYAPTLAAYYLARNVSREFVRAEKQRVFGQTEAVEVRAAAPEIVFGDGARTALMRFRKQYEIRNRTGARRGEVVQELRWQRRSDDTWKIVSERDVRVIR